MSTHATPRPPRVLVSDSLAPTALAVFERRGVQADLRPELGKDPAALAAALPGYDGLAVRSATQVTGALLQNERLKYVCKPVSLEVTNAQTRFTSGYGGRREAVMTVGNGEGNYFADEATLDRLEGEGQVVFRYRDNPNGSARDIAGIVNARGNVLGMMPHPERAIDRAHGGTDGLRLFEAALGVLA